MNKTDLKKRNKAAIKFLKGFGFKPTSSKRLESTAFDAAIRQAGGNPAACSQNPQWAAEFDANYCNEGVGRLFVNASYYSLLVRLLRLETLPGFPSALHRVAYLGSGHGIDAIWIAQQHPEASVVVYGISANALGFGRRLAESRGLRNIEFVQKSYKQLAEENPTHDCELVIYYRGAVPDEMRTEHNAFLCREMPTEAKCASIQTMAHAAAAMANLLGVNGVGVFTGAFSEWGLSHQCDAFRRADLSISWPDTHLTTCQNEDVSKIEGFYLFLTPGGPRITESGYEDARAILASADPFVKNMQLAPGLLESFSELFVSGKTLLTIEAKDRMGGIARIRLILKAGLILCEFTNTRGLRGGAVDGVAHIGPFTEFVHDSITEWLQEPGTQVKVVTLQRDYQAMAQRWTASWPPAATTSA